MKLLAMDSETTGLILYHDPSEDPRQPHIVELAALLIDTVTGETEETVHAIVRPDGWTIPDEVAAIHGITTERAMDEGIPEHEVIAAYLDLHQRCALRAAHNEPFDARIMRIGIKRFGDGRPTHAMLTQEQKDAIADEYKTMPRFCTQRATTKLCKLPPTPAMVAKGMKWSKSPKLTELYAFLFGEELQGAHGALADAQAVARVYLHLQAIGEIA